MITKSRIWQFCSGANTKTVQVVHENVRDAGLIVVRRPYQVYLLTLWSRRVSQTEDATDPRRDTAHWMLVRAK